MKYFVSEDSIVRKIWGQADAILFIFAGASAEFALNKAVDWLYFTGRLPTDPLGRLFSTVGYARQIVFSEYDAAIHAIDKITAIHQGVEKERGAKIPDWAYRDVLFMLVDYSIRSFEVLERKLTEDEKGEIFEVFHQVGARMDISGLPQHYEQWRIMREEHLKENLLKSDFTLDLYKQYKKHLGPVRYRLLLQVQVLVVPERVNALLSLGNFRVLDPVLSLYKLTRFFGIEKVIRNSILPRDYKKQVIDLDGM
ncbi:oxygenase MpaB family protein [Dyadobacter sp. LHD-138]|uniref:oxygenase MpaB family protein n=1 Tax=Dyadobacter sp. LHD-138 TaxID=3071413 RepID=UPI0027E0214C|nr:oxygenase MpaB family protein [Dyadobacter sp. LHD-138]MDQ6478100.1 oxygenase MpaB family protein [Dyadobacter sp. LHD-138]